MATGSAQDEQGLPKVELQQLSREFQLVVEQGQASMMLAMREMMAEFMRNKGRSESSSAGSSAAGREGPRGAEPSAVRTSVAAVAGDTAAERETTLRGEASRNLGATGRREAAVPVEVGPARGQPDQPRRAGEWDAFPGGELGGNFDMPISRHLAYKYNTAPVFSGLKPEFISWTKDARYYAKGVGFLSAFVSDPPQYIPVGELDTENSVLVARGYSRESVHIHTLAWNFLSTALKSKSDKSILHRCTSPREAWDALLAWYGPQTTGAKSDLSRRLNSFKIAPGSNPLEEMGRIEDLAAEMRTAGLTLDDHMLYTIFIDALPAEYEVEARNLASRDSIGRDDIIKAVRERHHRLSGNRKKGSNAGYAGHAMFAGGSGGGGSRGKGGGGGGRGKGGGGGGHGKGGGHGNGKGGRRGQHGRGGKGTNEDGGGSAAAAGGDGSSA